VLIGLVDADRIDPDPAVLFEARISANSCEKRKQTVQKGEWGPVDINRLRAVVGWSPHVGESDKLWTLRIIEVEVFEVTLYAAAYASIEMQEAYRSELFVSVLL